MATGRQKRGPISVQQVEKIIQSEMKQEIQQAAALIVRPVGRPKGSTPFQRVMKAREMLANSSTFAMQMLKKAAKNAAVTGDSRPAEFLLKHAAVEDEKGKLVRPIHSSVDKLEGESGSRAPIINIGWVTPVQPPAINAIDVKALPPADELT